MEECIKPNVISIRRLLNKPVLNFSNQLLGYVHDFLLDSESQKPIYLLLNTKETVDVENRTCLIPWVEVFYDKEKHEIRFNKESSGIKKLFRVDEAGKLPELLSKELV